MSERFARYLKQQRDRLGINQVQLAERLGVTKSCICRIEKGGLEPGDELIGKIAEVLGDRPERLRLMCGKLPPELVEAIAYALLDAKEGEAVVISK